MENVVSSEDLNRLQDMHAKFTKMKISLGDLELTKQDLLQEIEMLKNDFVKQEKQLIETYGANAVINIKTGEITYKNK